MTEARLDAIARLSRSPAPDTALVHDADAGSTKHGSGYGDKRQRTTSLTADQDETFADRDQGRHAPGQTKALISNVALVAADATTRAARTLQFAASLGKPPPGRSFIAYPEPALSAGKRISASRTGREDANLHLANLLPASIESAPVPSASNSGKDVKTAQNKVKVRAAVPATPADRQGGRAKIGGSSKFRGVTKHSTTGRYESHLWDANAVRPKQNKGGRTRGKQLYMGGYDNEEDAARTWDIAAIKWGLSPLNFDRNDYADQFEVINSLTKDELITHLKRNSSGFSRGRSQFRGVTSHRGTKGRSTTPQFEARLGNCNPSGNTRYSYLGVFSSETDAALAYDQAARELNGSKAVVNFPTSDGSRSSSAKDEPREMQQWALPALSSSSGSFAFDSCNLPVEPSSPTMLPPSNPDQQILFHSPTTALNSIDSCIVTSGSPDSFTQTITPANGGIPAEPPLLSMELPTPTSPSTPLHMFGHAPGAALDQDWMSAELHLAHDELPWYDTMLSIDDAADAWNECLQNHHNGGMPVL